MSDLSEVRALIRAVRRRWFGVVAMRTIARGALAAAVPVLLAVAADGLLGPRGAALLLLAGFTLAVAMAGAGLVLWRMERRPDDRHVARFIEERAARLEISPPLDDALVSAVEMGEAADPDNRAFASLIVGQALARVRDLDPAAVVPGHALRRSAGELAIAAAVLVVAAVVAVPGLRRTVETAWIGLLPHTITLEVAPGDTRVAAGRPLTIRATLRGGGAALREVTPSLVVSAGGQQRTVTMVPDAGGFAFAFASIDRSFSYQVTAASTASRQYAVTALFPPRVKRIDVLYDYPSFSGLRARQDEDSGDVYGPAGTRVRLRVHTDKPVASGELALGGGRTAALKADGAVAEAELVLSRDDSYRVRLADADGLRSTGETEYFIRLMDDRPPDVRILRPSSDQGITPLEEITIEASADDDYGIAAFDLVYSVAGRAERAVPFRRTTGTTAAKVGSYLLAAEDLGVQPGDVITYYARARDIGRGKRPTVTRSDIFFLEVKPFTEEFVAAQSQSMGGGSGTQIDSLVAAQKEIINATWNLERRAAAGRSAEDVKAIAQAQAELKTRVEQVAGAGRRGRRPFPPQQIDRQSGRGQGGGEAVAAAIEAMTRAVQQLEASRTGDALPHEMAALQGLLRAQAEVRRRQVMQQSASAGSQGGSGRSGEDLSALFDRELQRQQRTNYEQPSQIEERPERQEENSALDRIRDLARRQEDLSRRQKELANANLSAEELKRQLETLTREQMELRRQAEEIERQVRSQGEQNQQGARGAQGSQSSQSSQQLRDASDQMRNAARDLERQDAGSAAERGRSAAERLRNLEQQLRGTGANAQETAAGELRLEAQQIAEAQRRIAGEAARLEQAPQGSADAMRRLASEKEQLAERVDELQRAADRLAREPAKAGAQPAAGAARGAAQELQREQIGRRMRESAKDMRSAAGAREDRPGGPRAETEQQLARALDRVVDTLGGGAQADARQLAERLEQTREIRERLNRLEQQVRDAEAAQRSESQGARGRGGREGNAPTGGRGGSDVARLREEYTRELQRARQTLGRLEAEQRSGMNMSTPEQHEYSRSAPGTEAFKQDFSGWTSLRRDIDLALERYDSAVSDRLARKLSDDRLSAGASDRVPDAYRELIARYYESLAKRKR